jgi:hypothetical protein
MYHFIALTHQATVIMTLFYLPFGSCSMRSGRCQSAWNTIRNARVKCPKQNALVAALNL